MSSKGVYGVFVFWVFVWLLAAVGYVVLAAIAVVAFCLLVLTMLLHLD